ncbi:MAG: OmpA family protein, partial [Bacteroidota bacterium]
MSASPSIWLLSRLGYADFSAVLSSRDTSTESIEPDGQSVYVVTRHEFHASLTGVKLAVGGGLEVIPGVIVGVAPTVTVVMGKEQNQIERIISPQDTPFLETGTETRPVAGGTPIVFKPVQFGADLMIEANIPLGSRLALRPEVRGSIFLGSVVDNASWSRSGLSGLIGLSYDFSHHPDSIPLPVAHPVQPPDTVRLADSTPKPYLSAKIKVYGIDQAGQRYADPVIEIEQAPWVEGVPIIPYIFFDSGASRIADRYVQIRNPEVRAHFAIDSLVAITPLDMHWQSLNVIGERLRANPGVKLTVNGTASSDEADAQALGEQRARSVAQYLTETWKIAPERITVTSPSRSIGGTPEESQEGRQENRRAELMLSDDIVLKPVIIHRLATIASPPAVRFSPEIIADTTVAEWYITVEQGGK